MNTISFLLSSFNHAFGARHSWEMSVVAKLIYGFVSFVSLYLVISPKVPSYMRVHLGIYVECTYSFLVIVRFIPDACFYMVQCVHGNCQLLLHVSMVTFFGPSLSPYLNITPRGQLDMRILQCFHVGCILFIANSVVFGDGSDT